MVTKKRTKSHKFIENEKSNSFPMKQLNPFAKYFKKDRGAPGNKDKEIKETLIFRDVNGLSLNFPKNDTSTVHKCRVSFKDQYIDNYNGHQVVYIKSDVILLIQIF